MGQVPLPLVGVVSFGNEVSEEAWGGGGGFCLMVVYLCVYVGTLRMGAIVVRCLD